MTSKYIQVTLSPKFDQYVPRNDLEYQLTLSNILHLMPSVEDGARRGFMREVKNVGLEYGVEFKIIKDTLHEIMWTVHLGNQNLGSYMVIYKTEKFKSPVWYGSKPRTLLKARDKAAVEIFENICTRLNEALANHTINSYSFHGRVKKWLNEICEMKIPRSTYLHPTPKTNTEDYLVDMRYAADIRSIAKIYTLFNMNVTFKEIDI